MLACIYLGLSIYISFYRPFEDAIDNSILYTWRFYYSFVVGHICIGMHTCSRTIEILHCLDSLQHMYSWSSLQIPWEHPPGWSCFYELCLSNAGNLVSEDFCWFNFLPSVVSSDGCTGLQLLLYVKYVTCTSGHKDLILWTMDGERKYFGFPTPTVSSMKHWDKRREPDTLSFSTDPCRKRIM